MKSIVLEISDKTYKTLLNAVAIRSMSGESFGVIDQAFRKVLAAIEAEQETVLLKLKEEK